MAAAQLRFARFTIPPKNAKRLHSFDNTRFFFGKTREGDLVALSHRKDLMSELHTRGVEHYKDLESPPPNIRSYYVQLGLDVEPPIGVIVLTVPQLWDVIEAGEHQQHILRAVGEHRRGLSLPLSPLQLSAYTRSKAPTMVEAIQSAERVYERWKYRLEPYGKFGVVSFVETLMVSNCLSAKKESERVERVKYGIRMLREAQGGASMIWFGHAQGVFDKKDIGSSLAIGAPEASLHVEDASNTSTANDKKRQISPSGATRSARPTPSPKRHCQDRPTGIKYARFFPLVPQTPPHQKFGSPDSGPDPAYSPLTAEELEELYASADDPLDNPFYTPPKDRDGCHSVYRANWFVIALTEKDPSKHIPRFIPPSPSDCPSEESSPAAAVKERMRLRKGKFVEREVTTIRTERVARSVSPRLSPRNKKQRLA